MSFTTQNQSSSSGSLLAGVAAAGSNSLANATAIQPGISYVQVSTAAATGAAGISLPAISNSGTVITVRNDGVGCCQVYGAAAAVAINGLAAGASWYVAANGGIVEFISAGSNQWYVISDVGLKTLPILTTATALTLTAAHNGMILAFPAMAAAWTGTLPAPASGYNFKAVMTGTAGFLIHFTSTAANINGGLFSSPAATGACTSQTFAAGGQTTVNFTATAVLGDQLAFESTNLIYSVIGIGGAVTSFSVA